MLSEPELELMEALSSLIAKKRREENLSMEELASIAKLSPRRVKALELGHENFGLEVLSKFASAFNTSVLELISEAEELRH